MIIVKKMLYTNLKKPYTLQWNLFYRLFILPRRSNEWGGTSYWSRYG